MDTMAIEGAVGRRRVEGGRRRRTYSLEDKRRLVAESYEPGASVSQVARRHDLNANLLFNWRRQLREPLRAQAPLALIPVELLRMEESDAPPARASGDSAPPVTGMMEIVLVDGVRLRVDSQVDGAALRRVLAVLQGTV